jgi:Flp pilus assembly protein TadD
MKKLLLLIPLIAALAAPPDFDRARELYQRTQYDAALKILDAMSQKDAPVYSLIGQCYFMQDDFKKAVEEFQKAIALNPNESENQLWLGRAFGRRAQTSSFMTAPGYASKAHVAFEKSVELDPRNVEAMSDLLEYYMEAPGFLGGGMDKAAVLATRMAALSPAEGAWAQARVAEKRKDLVTAEKQFRRAAELAPGQVGRVIDIAKFLARAGRYQESEQAFRQAESMAPNSPKLMFEHASTYIKTKRNLETARQLLRRYLGAPLTPDDPSRKEAEELLRQVS